jgi:hypothetical protein
MALREEKMWNNGKGSSKASRHCSTLWHVNERNLSPEDKYRAIDIAERAHPL